MNRKKLEQIRALLRKAEADGVTPDEAEALSAKAFELAARYEIDETLVRAAEDRPAEKIETRTGTVQRPFNQLQSLVYIVYTFCGATSVKVSKDKYYVHGFASDLDRAEMLLTSLLVQGTRQATTDYRTMAQSHTGSASDSVERRSTYKRSWWAAFAGTLHRRFIEIKAQQVAKTETNTGSVSTAVALRDKDAQIKEYVESMHSNLRMTHSRRVSGSGGSAGRRAGERADIGGSRLTSERQAIG